MVHILYKCPDCRARAASRIPPPPLKDKDNSEQDDKEASIWYFFDMCDSCKSVIKDGYGSNRPWVCQPAAPEVSTTYYTTMFTFEVY